MYFYKRQLLILLVFIGMPVTAVNVTDSLPPRALIDNLDSVALSSWPLVTAADLVPRLESQTNKQPCSIGKSILFTREDVQAGTELLRIPSMPEEMWNLTENGPVGYLALHDRGDHYQVVFARPPDIEEINRLDGAIRESVSFILRCSYKGRNYKFRQELIIQDINEHPPEFDKTRSYKINVSENTAIGTSIFSLRHLAFDPDVTGRVAGYVLWPYSNPQRDGRRFFRISEDGANIVSFQPLDFDTLIKKGGILLTLNITAMDNGLPKPLTAHVLFDIEVIDTDDQGPVFWYPDCPLVGGLCATPYFQTVIKCGFKGTLRLYPGPVRAKDTDSLNSSISYSITRVDPEEFSQHFEIDSETGDVRSLKTSCSASVNEVIVIIKATESYFFRRSVSTTLQITILDNLILQRRVWDVDPVEGTPPENGNQEKQEQSYRSLPLVLFVISIFGFISIGGGLAFAAIRFSKARKSRNLECVPKCSLDCKCVSENGNCDKLENSNIIIPSIPSAVTSFSICPTPDSPDHDSSHFSQGSMDENKGSYDFQSSCRGPKDERDHESVHGNAPHFIHLNGNLSEVKGETRGSDENQPTKDNSNQPCQRVNPQVNHQQQVQHLSQQSHLEDDDQQVPFTPNVFSQRRNLFQQENCHQAICGGPIIMSPPLLPRTKSQDLSVKQANLCGSQTDGSWTFLRDCNGAVPFNSPFSGHSQTSVNGSLHEKQWLESFVHEKGNFKNGLNKSSSFREHLNQMVPEFLKVNNSSTCFKSSNLALNKPDDTYDDDSMTEGLPNGSHKVRFNITELSSI